MDRDHLEPAIGGCFPEARTKHLAVLALVCLGLPACQLDDPPLVIVARSDLTPHEEVDRIDVELVGAGAATSTPVTPSDSLRDGLTIYDRDLAALSGRHVRITLFLEDQEIATRDLVFDHLTAREIIVDLPRLCVDVGCDAGETCVVGQCAPWTCVVGSEPECPEPMCTADAQCSMDDVACATGVCAEDTCLAYGDDTSCDVDEWCDPLRGCVPRRADADAWVAGPDASSNAEADAAAEDVDAGTPPI